MKRRISVIFACILACAMLAGCGKKPEQGTSSAGDASANAVENGSANASAAADASGDDQAAPDGEHSVLDMHEDNVVVDPPFVPLATGDAADDVPAPEPPADSGKLHVSIATVSISMDQLKAQDYKVPVLVTLDKNPGIIYSEWGLHIDPKCTFTADSENCKFQTVHVENAEQHFLWTAWTTVSVYKGTGSILEVELKLPMDAKPGDSYTITYADTSLAEKGDVWNDGETDYATADGGMTWTDGGVKVTN